MSNVKILLNKPLFKEFHNIIDICSPLNCLGILGFIYMKVYPDGTLTDFATHPTWSELFFKKLFQLKYPKNEIKDHIYQSEGISLWESNHQKDLWQEGRELFQMGNGISLATRHPEYTEIYCYYSHRQNYKINEFYMNNLDLLGHFSIYFKDKAKKIIQKGDQDKFIIPTHYKRFVDFKSPKDLDKNIKDKFYPLLDIKRFYLQGNKYLSYREAEYLYWCTRGKTAEEIGMILNTSKRTVETQINKLKRKLNCVNKSQLILLVSKLNLDKLLG